MDSALVVGGTRFVGRHTVTELLAHDYDVTLLTRGETPIPFDEDEITHVAGDRNDREALEDARDAADPGLVIDTCAYHPGQVEEATEVFAGSRYVYVSSGSAYEAEHVPMREDATPLYDCTPEQAEAESAESYGPRKAEGDRVVARAAADGVEAMAVRPMLVYGPHDYTERFDYWLHQLETRDRVLVPGDGDSLLHRVFVTDVASGLRIVGEEGEPGGWYNVADQRAACIDETLELCADALDTDAELVHASKRALDEEGIDFLDFPHVSPRPALAATEKLAALDWASTSLPEALAATVEEYRESERDGREVGPDPERVDRVLAALD